MSEPEIARRCVACGVSVREHAMFCPQCGNPIPQQSVATSLSGAETMVDSAPAEKPPQVIAVHKPTDHSVRGRVEQIRKVSSVVIDQAAYDPSLRFLLVAAAFFILFIVLVILSKVIG
jgi:uncharacterized membrane protein YvbJ